MAHGVLLVEDEPETRDHLAQTIRELPGFELMATAATIAEGRQLLERHAPELLLTDLGLPDGSGIELIRAAVAQGGTLPLVITVFGDEAHVVDAIRSGALGYLLKGERPEQLGVALQEIVDGGSPITPSIARYLIGIVRGASPGPAPDAPKLSAREMEVLRHIVKGFTYEESARLIGIASTTVATHIRKVYRKLAVHSRSEATYEALALGLIRPDE